MASGAGGLARTLPRRVAVGPARWLGGGSVAAPRGADLATVRGQLGTNAGHPAAAPRGGGGHPAAARWGLGGSVAPLHPGSHPATRGATLPPLHPAAARWGTGHPGSHPATRRRLRGGAGSVAGLHSTPGAGGAPLHPGRGGRLGGGSVARWGLGGSVAASGGRRWLGGGSVGAGGLRGQGRGQGGSEGGRLGGSVAGLGGGHRRPVGAGWQGGPAGWRAVLPKTPCWWGSWPGERAVGAILGDLPRVPATTAICARCTAGRGAGGLREGGRWGLGGARSCVAESAHHHGHMGQIPGERPTVATCEGHPTRASVYAPSRQSAPTGHRAGHRHPGRGYAIRPISRALSGIYVGSRRIGGGARGPPPPRSPRLRF